MIWDKAKDWYSHPFKSDMDTKGWFLFIGLIVILMILWRMILSHLFEAVS